MKLKTGNKYRIGNEVHEVVIEPADGCCMEECSIKNCHANKAFQQFLKDCKATMCIQILGIGRMFKKAE